MKAHQNSHNLCWVLLCLVFTFSTYSCKSQIIKLSDQTLVVHELQLQQGYLESEIERVKGLKDADLELKSLYQQYESVKDELNDTYIKVRPRPLPNPCPPANCFYKDTKYILSNNKEGLKLRLLDFKNNILGETSAEGVRVDEIPGIYAYKLIQKDNLGNSGIIQVSTLDTKGNPIKYELKVEFN